MVSSTRFLFAIALSVLFSQGDCRITKEPRQSALGVVKPQPCLQYSTSKINFIARYKDTPTSSIPINVIDVNTVPKVGYSILSACSTCFSYWSSIIFNNGTMLPQSSTNPILQTVSYSLLEGESPSYISIQFPPPALNGYCMMANRIDPNGPPILGGHNRPDLWSLCPNSTANGRLDIVWSPKDNHTHYTKSSCKGVYLEQKQI